MKTNVKRPSREELYARYRQEAADTIREARMQKRLGQKELAELVGISPAQLCRIENGDSRPTKPTLQKLSAYIDIPYPELLSIAGYSNAKGDETLFNKDGEKLDTFNLVSSIYKADSSLLECFRDFETFGDEENVRVLKVLLHSMRKEVELREIGESNSLFLNTFKALKRFIITALMDA